MTGFTARAGRRPYARAITQRTAERSEGVEPMRRQIRRLAFLAVATGLALLPLANEMAQAGRFLA